MNCAWRPRRAAPGDESAWVKWTVWRRYSQFYKLHRDIKPLVASVDNDMSVRSGPPPTPQSFAGGGRDRAGSFESAVGSRVLSLPSKYMFVSNEKAIRKRQDQLNAYWHALMSRQQLVEFDQTSCSPQLRAFLEVNKHVKTTKI